MLFAKSVVATKIKLIIIRRDLFSLNVIRRWPDIEQYPIREKLT